MPKGEMGHQQSPINDRDFLQPNEEVMKMWKKRKREEQIKRETEKQDRGWRREEERLLREEKREIEKREKFLHNESSKRTGSMTNMKRIIMDKKKTSQRFGNTHEQALEVCLLH